MEEFKEFTGKSVSEAISEACISLSKTSDELNYEVIEEGSAGILGLGKKPAKIKVYLGEAPKVENSEEKVEETTKEEVKEVAKDVVKENVAASNDNIEETAKEFLNKVFKAMDMEVKLDIKMNETDKTLEINMEGDNMGTLIGKRGQTIDSLQYLVSLVINKDRADYTRVKIDTENYRARRKKTLEELAKNIAFKVKRTRRSVSLEPMNPYERRIIHSALQNDKYVTTKSEGEEPYRHIIVLLKK
jgi:spoIIIJ-associated protein